MIEYTQAMIFDGEHAKPEMLFEVHPRLAMIMFDTACWFQKIKKTVTWTSIIRPKLEDSGIHAACRAADCSIKNLTPAEQWGLENYLNAKYKYDIIDRRAVAKLNDGGTYNGMPKAPHLHIQVGLGYI